MTFTSCMPMSHVWTPSFILGIWFCHPCYLSWVFSLIIITFIKLECPVIQFLSFISLLNHKVVLVVPSCKTSVESQNCVAKLYAILLFSRTMGLAEQLTLINRGSQPVTDYLTIADELGLIGTPVPNQYLITYSLNGVATEFKEVVTATWA